MKKILKSIVVSILTWEARAALKRHSPKIVAVTGNVGKTSTKDAVYAVVSTAFLARKSEKSFNSEIGTPLAILGLETAWSSAAGWASNICKGFKIAFFDRDFPEWLVLEVGADHPGDIESIARWLRPDIVVLTRMSSVPVHVEFFKDAGEVLKEKMFLAKALKDGGTLVVNADDQIFEDAVRELAVPKIFYGAAKAALPRIVETEITFDGTPLSLPTGQYAIIDLGGKEAKIELKGVLGNHLMYPLAAAAAVGRALHIEGIVPDALNCFAAPKGRMRIHKGKESSAIIDDTYNSSPIACAEALKTLGSLSNRGRKIAVLGDMKELGEKATEAHREIGRLAAEKVHTLAVVGVLGCEIASGAREAGLAPDRIFEFETSSEASDALRDIMRAGDVVLVKGSQSMRMERVVKELLEDPSQALELLVRQEREWESR
jgi:UDP-N-acetylmuramyl pentapeptide synthase